MTIKLKKDDTFDGFWDSLPEAVQEVLLDLDPDGRAGVQEHDVPGVGRVECWLDECSEGADRGGYVTWLRLHGVLDHEGDPLVLESETDGSEYMFEGRMTRLI